MAGERTDAPGGVVAFAGTGNDDANDDAEEAAVDLMTPRAVVGSLFVAAAGWMLLAIVWAPGRFLVTPRPVHLTHQFVALFTG